MKKTACGYIRVSSIEQTTGESLSTQKKSISDKAKLLNFNLGKIYSDAGISGKSTIERTAFQQMIDAIKKGQYDYLIIYKLSRLGRNCRDLLNTVEILKENDTALISIKESIDLSTPLGNLLFQVLGAVAEFERETIREQTLENKLARMAKGIPVAGAMPYARTYDKETGKWSLDKTKANTIKRAAKRYLDGESARKIASDIGISYAGLLNIWKRSCGDIWTVNYKGVEPFTFKVPRILDDNTIQKVLDRIEHQTQFNRTDSKNYVLTGFLRCLDCKGAFNGQTQIRNSVEYTYYRHYPNKNNGCSVKKTSFAVAASKVDDAFFKEIYNHIYDGAAFQESVKTFLPDENYIRILKDDIEALEKDLDNAQNKLDKLVDAYIDGKLKKSTIKNKEKSILEKIDNIKNQLNEKQEKLATLPNPNKAMQDAEDLRLALMDYYKSDKWQSKMSFNDKKRFLHWLFNGKDSAGVPYGLYAKRIGNTRSVLLVIYSKLVKGPLTVENNKIYRGFGPNRAFGKKALNIIFDNLIEFYEDPNYKTSKEGQMLLLC